MRRVQRIAILACVAIAAVAAIDASGRGSARPPRYAPSAFDSDLTIVKNPVDGRDWAVWSYQAGTEFDVAVSVVDYFGEWQLPIFIGQGDRRNQVQPSLATDAAGTMYLAFIDGPERRLLLTTLRFGETEWSPALTLSAPGDRAARPVLRIVQDRLVVAYTAAGVVRLRDYELSPDGGLADGITESPDPWNQRPPPDPPPTNQDDGNTKSPTPR